MKQQETATECHAPGSSHDYRPPSAPLAGIGQALRALGWQGMLVLFLAIAFLLVRLAPPHHAFEGVANYAWLHLALETLSILVAGLVFGVAWNSYSTERAGNIVILAVGLLATGIIDFVHALSFKGMPYLVTPSDPEKAINFWLAARLVFALVLATVSLRSWAPLRRPRVRYAGLAAALAATAAVVWFGLFHQDDLPHTFIADHGLTAFKIAMEYVIIAILVVPAVAFLWSDDEQRAHDSPSLFAAAAVSILSELNFTLYADVTDVFNLLGHVYKVVAFGLIYRAVFVGSVREPFERAIEAEAKMRAASFYVRNLIEASLDPLVMISPDGKITDVNKATEQATGLHRAKLIGTDFCDYFTEPETARAGYRKALDEGMVRNYPLELRHVSGSSIYVLYNATAYTDERRRVQGVFAAARDVTEKRRAEQALQRQHMLLSNITQTSPIGITMWDLNGKITFANPEAERILARSLPDIAQLPYNASDWQITDFHGRKLADDELPYHRALATREPVYNIQLAVAGRNGKRVLLSVNASPLLNEAGQVDGVVATLDDVTQREMAEEMLRTSEERLKLAMDAAHMGIWTWDVVNDVVSYSEEYSLLMGLPRGVSHPNRDAVMAAIHPEDRERMAGVLQQALVKERGDWVDFRIVWPDKSEHWVSVHATVIRDAQGKPLRVSGLGMDITERKQNELALSRATRALRSLSAANERLIHAQDEQELLNSVCRVIVEVGGYRMAWVGEAVDDEYKSVRRMAQWGDDSGFIDAVKFTWSDAERGHGPTGSAIRTGITQVNQNYATNPQVKPWREEALKRNYQSSIAFPLRDESGVHGVLTIYAAEPDAFDQDEVRLLQELADDLAFGIVTLRNGAERNRMLKEQRHYETRLRESLVESIQAIAATLELRDPYTAGHQRRVAALAVAIAGKMGLPDAQVEGLHLAASIHDVGKICVPAEILNKPGGLTPIELELIRMHAKAGHDILKDVRFPWPIARIVLEHHEHLDGSGYPGGLRRDGILLESRILTVADVVEAMTSHRPYRPGLGVDTALEHIAACRGSWYEPEAVDACLKLFHEDGYQFAAVPAQPEQGGNPPASGAARPAN